MDWKNLTLYPQLIIDLLLYLGFGVLLAILSKWIWEAKEERRLRKEMEVYQQMKDDEE